MDTLRENAGGNRDDESSSYSDAAGLSFGDVWDDDDISDGEVHDSNSASSSTVGTVFFKPPAQRQKWGDDYILPHVNWGDLFFDLFYVGVAYNLSGVIKGGISGGDDLSVALLYFFGCFGTVFSCFWQFKMLFDARFEVPKDIGHWTMEIFFLCWLAMATQHIRPASVMAVNGPGENQEMFFFCLANLLGMLTYLLLCFEIGFIWVKGQVSIARFNARTEFLFNSMNFAFILAATIYSGWKYFGGDSGGEQDHVAISILIVGWLVRPMLMIFSLWYRGLFAKGANQRQMSVPMNIDFIIHRYGEWMMLMLGESILSLVIVDKISKENDEKYYWTFFYGVVCVIMLQLLYFTSMPHSKEHHAYRRSRAAGIFFGFVNQFYSAALIVVGVSYKLLLLEYTDKYSEYDKGDKIRFLGQDGVIERRSQIAKLFCFSLSAAYITLDVLNLTHTGVSAYINKYRVKDKKRWKVMGLVIVAFLRHCSVAALLAGGYYLDVVKFDPAYIALIGVLSVFLQVSLRYLGKTYFLEKDAGHSPESNHDNHGGDSDAGGVENESKGLTIWGMPFVLPPMQRQKWGDDYSLPHVNWGDLFFDLFYVGAAYNLGTNIKYDIDQPGLALLYFFGIFGPILSSFWSAKMLYEARFVLPEDFFHRAVEILHLCMLAMATQHIRPIKYMSNCREHQEMFLFCLANVLGSLTYLFLNAEIGFGWVVGQDAAKFNGRTEFLHQSLCLVLKVAATVYSGLQYSGALGSDIKLDHVPICLLLVGWLCVFPLMFLTHWSRGLWKKEVDFRRFTVPMNVHFVIHRYGEWIMLMLGESVLSLVIVDGIADSNDGKYYLVFFFGVLSVIFLQILHFKSQPRDAVHHALRRSRLGGMAFSVLIQVYSAALILVGVSFKLMLTELKPDDNHRTIRSLGSEAGHANHEHHRDAITYYFCYSLAATFVNLDLINLAHSGIAEAIRRCFLETQKLAVKAIALVVLSRYCIVVGVVIIGPFFSDHLEYIAFLGFVAVALQVGIRVLQARYFRDKAKRHSIENKEAVGISPMGLDLFRDSVRLLETPEATNPQPDDLQFKESDENSC